MTDRIQCCVPFCKRTHRNTEGFQEWICGPHWKCVAKDRRRAYGRYAGRWRRFKVEGDGIAAGRLWDAVKREAIERAVGL